MSVVGDIQFDFENDSLDYHTETVLDSGDTFSLQRTWIRVNQRCRHYERWLINNWRATAVQLCYYILLECYGATLELIISQLESTNECGNYFHVSVLTTCANETITVSLEYVKRLMIKMMNPDCFMYHIAKIKDVYLATRLAIAAHPRFLEKEIPDHLTKCSMLTPDAESYNKNAFIHICNLVSSKHVEKSYKCYLYIYKCFEHPTLYDYVKSKSFGAYTKKFGQRGSCHIIKCLNAPAHYWRTLPCFGDYYAHKKPLNKEAREGKYTNLCKTLNMYTLTGLYGFNQPDRGLAAIIKFLSLMCEAALLELEIYGGFNLDIMFKVPSFTYVDVDTLEMTVYSKLRDDIDNPVSSTISVTSKVVHLYLGTLNQIAYSRSDLFSRMITGAKTNVKGLYILKRDYTNGEKFSNCLKLIVSPQIADIMATCLECSKAKIAYSQMKYQEANSILRTMYIEQTAWNFAMDNQKKRMDMLRQH